MPGKVNPVLCESVNQVAARVFGNDATVAYGASQGILELNTYLPVMAGRALRVRDALLANVSQCSRSSASPGSRPTSSAAATSRAVSALATTLNPIIGYAQAASWSTAPSISALDHRGASRPSTWKVKGAALLEPTARSVAPHWGSRSAGQLACRASSRPLAPKRNVVGVAHPRAHDRVGQVEVAVASARVRIPPRRLEADGAATDLDRLEDDLGRLGGGRHLPSCPWRS